MRGQEYDDFIESFVTAVMERWPHVLLQWEDFAGANAARLLERYRDRLCTFNDDIQGTAAVATATLLAAINVTGKPLTEQRIAMLGFGSAGVGIASLMVKAMQEAGLSEQDARDRVYAVDKDGLLVEGYSGLHPTQQPFVKKREQVAGWKLAAPDKIGLLDVVQNAKPTVVIGVSGQPGVFTREMVQAMTSYVERPIIFPLSNPTSRSEATPQDLLDWSNGTALVGTGSPFPPVTVNGQSIPIDQTNNSYVFPGVALGVISSKASRVTTRCSWLRPKRWPGFLPRSRIRRAVCCLRLWRFPRFRLRLRSQSPNRHARKTLRSSAPRKKLSKRCAPMFGSLAICLIDWCGARQRRASWHMLRHRPSMIPERRVKLFKNGRNQAVRIPREFELPGNDAIMRKEGEKLIIEPALPQSLLQFLSTLKPLDEDFPPIGDATPRPVKI